MLLGATRFRLKQQEQRWLRSYRSEVAGSTTALAWGDASERRVFASRVAALRIWVTGRDDTPGIPRCYCCYCCRTVKMS